VVYFRVTIMFKSLKSEKIFSNRPLPELKSSWITDFNYLTVLEFIIFLNCYSMVKHSDLQF